MSFKVLFLLDSLPGQYESQYAVRAEPDEEPGRDGRQGGQLEHPPGSDHLNTKVLQF